MAQPHFLEIRLFPHWILTKICLLGSKVGLNISLGFFLFCSACHGWSCCASPVCINITKVEWGSKQTIIIINLIANALYILIKSQSATVKETAAEVKVRQRVCTDFISHLLIMLCSDPAVTKGWWSIITYSLSVGIDLTLFCEGKQYLLLLLRCLNKAAWRKQ